MKKIHYMFCGVTAASLLLASCATAPTTLYNWHNYPQYSYQYVKVADAESKANLIAEYEKILTEQDGIRGTIPPGMCADYGYICLLDGDREKGVALLKREVELYPESAKVVERILKAVEE